MNSEKIKFKEQNIGRVKFLNGRFKHFFQLEFDLNVIDDDLLIVIQKILQ